MTHATTSGTVAADLNLFGLPTDTAIMDTRATCTTMAHAAHLEDVQPAQPGQDISGAANGSKMHVSHTGTLPITSDISVNPSVTKDCVANLIRIGDLLNQRPYLAMYIAPAQTGKHVMQLINEEDQKMLLTIINTVCFSRTTGPHQALSSKTYR